jgi:hypothetical protein
MPLTVNVGYSEKLGRPEFGSIGASCHVECELDGRLAFDDPEKLQSKIQELYIACSRAVQNELDRHRSAGTVASSTATNGSRKSSKDARPTAESRSAAASNGSTNHRASKRQLEYVEQLARQIAGLGTRHLESLAQRVCSKPLADLSSFDASSLIDTLKALKEGRLDVEAALKGGGG